MQHLNAIHINEPQCEVEYSILCSRRIISSWELICWKQKKKVKCIDLSNFENGQILMTRSLSQSISRAAHLVGYSRYVVVSTYQKWSAVCAGKISSIHVGPTSKLKRIKGSAAKLVSDTRGYLHRSCGVHASPGQRCFSCMKGTGGFNIVADWCNYAHIYIHVLTQNCT